MKGYINNFLGVQSKRLTKKSNFRALDIIAKILLPSIKFKLWIKEQKNSSTDVGRIY